MNYKIIFFIILATSFAKYALAIDEAELTKKKYRSLVKKHRSVDKSITLMNAEEEKNRCLLFVHGTNEDLISIGKLLDFKTKKEKIDQTNLIKKPILKNWKQLYDMTLEKFDVTCNGKVSEEDYFSWNDYADTSTVARFGCAIELAKFLRKKNIYDDNNPNSSAPNILAHSHGGNCVQLATQNIYQIKYEAKTITRKVKIISNEVGDPEYEEYEKDITVAVNYPLAALDNHTGYLSQATIVNFIVDFLTYTNRALKMLKNSAKDFTQEMNNLKKEANFLERNRLEVLFTWHDPKLQQMTWEIANLNDLKSDTVIENLIMRYCESKDKSEYYLSELCSEHQSSKYSVFFTRQLNALKRYTQEISSGINLVSRAVKFNNVISLNVPPLLGSYHRMKIDDMYTKDDNEKLSSYFYTKHHTIGNPYNPNWDNILNSFHYFSSTHDGVVYSAIKGESSLINRMLNFTDGRESATNKRLVLDLHILFPIFNEKAKRNTTFERIIANEYIRFPWFLSQGYQQNKVKRYLNKFSGNLKKMDIDDYDAEITYEDKAVNFIASLLKVSIKNVIKIIDVHSLFYKNKKNIVKLYDFLFSAKNQSTVTN